MPGGLKKSTAVDGREKNKKKGIRYFKVIFFKINSYFSEINGQRQGGWGLR
jgi:hypothetical protein